jgi:hypothetical protein
VGDRHHTDQSLGTWNLGASGIAERVKASLGRAVEGGLLVSSQLFFEHVSFLYGSGGGSACIVSVLRPVAPRHPNCLFLLLRNFDLICFRPCHRCNKHRCQASYRLLACGPSGFHTLCCTDYIRPLTLPNSCPVEQLSLASRPSAVRSHLDIRIWWGRISSRVCGIVADRHGLPAACAV